MISISFWSILAVDCGNPDEADDNGSVRFGDTTLGNTAYYFCNQGFILEGSATVECLYTGEWSDTAPVCRRKLYLKISSISSDYSLLPQLLTVDNQIVQMIMEVYV